jgi:superfamily II DNA or RNA helicase
VPTDLAKQEEIAASLASIKWDLVVIDEAHQLSGPQRRALLERLISSGAADRLLLLSAFPLPHDVASLIPGLVTTHRSRSEVMAAAGTPLPPITYVVVEYRRGEDEVAFLENLRNEASELTRASGTQALFNLLSLRAQSSIFALEQTLLRLKSRLQGPPRNAEQILLSLLKADSENTDPTDTSADVSARTVDGPKESKEFLDPASLLLVVSKLLEGVDRVTSDEKAKALLQVLQREAKEQNAPQWSCVTSRFAETANYVHSALKHAGYTTNLAIGELSITEHEESWTQFQKAGGVLVLTLAAGEGFTLPQVRLLVHFDHPQTPQLLEQWLGRIHRFGRSDPCTIAGLHDQSGVFASEDLYLNQFRRLQKIPFGDPP